MILQSLTTVRKDLVEIPEIEMGAPAWMPSGRVVQNPADGNCLWYALAETASTADKKRWHPQMRAWTVSLMKANQDLEKLWIDHLRPDSRGNSSQLTWQEYLQEQSTVGAWSGAFEGTVCCEALDLRLWICVDDGNLRVLNKGGASGFVCLKFQSAGHYELSRRLNCAKD